MANYDSDIDEATLEAKGLFRCSDCSDEAPLKEKVVTADMNWYCKKCALDHTDV